MKNLIKLLFLGLFITTYSCKDKNPDAFIPSLDLEEYVTMNFNGVERLFTSDNYINGTLYVFPDGREQLNISLYPSLDNYSSFYFEIKEPSVGIFDKEDIEFIFLDYSLTDEFPYMQAMCGSPECLGNVEIKIHEFGGVGEKIIGEYSGVLEDVNDATIINNFEGEFVVNRKE